MVECRFVVPKVAGSSPVFFEMIIKKNLLHARVLVFKKIILPAIVFVFIVVGIFCDLNSILSCFLNGWSILFSFVAGFLNVGNLCYCFEGEDLLNNTRDKNNLSTEVDDGNATEEKNPPFWRWRGFWYSVSGITVGAVLIWYFWDDFDFKGVLGILSTSFFPQEVPKGCKLLTYIQPYLELGRSLADAGLVKETVEMAQEKGRFKHICISLGALVGSGGVTLDLTNLTEQQLYALIRFIRLAHTCGSREIVSVEFLKYLLNNWEAPI